MKFLFLSALTFLSIFPGFALICIKPAQKTVMAQVIYLHGMDTLSASSQELQIRKVLEGLSNEFGISFALPRAFEKCPESKKQICWMWGAEKKEIIKAKRNKILKQTRSCFNKSLTTLWLGFSNGGNLISQIFQECSGKGKYITFGASGGYIKDKLGSLKNCGRYKALIGKNDKWNYSRAIKFYSTLKNKNGHVSVSEFDGGHEINVKLLRKALKEYIK